MLFVAALNLTTPAGARRAVFGSRVPALLLAPSCIASQNPRRRLHTPKAAKEYQFEPSLGLSATRSTPSRRRLQPRSEEGGDRLRAAFPRAREGARPGRRTPTESEPDKKTPESHSPHPPLAAAGDVERNAEGLLSRTHGRSGTEM